MDNAYWEKKCEDLRMELDDVLRTQSRLSNVQSRFDDAFLENIVSRVQEKCKGWIEQSCREQMLRLVWEDFKRRYGIIISVVTILISLGVIGASASIVASRWTTQKLEALIQERQDVVSTQMETSKATINQAVVDLGKRLGEAQHVFEEADKKVIEHIKSAKFLREDATKMRQEIFSMAEELRDKLKALNQDRVEAIANQILAVSQDAKATEIAQNLGTAAAELVDIRKEVPQFVSSKPGGVYRWGIEFPATKLRIDCDGVGNLEWYQNGELLYKYKISMQETFNKP